MAEVTLQNSIITGTSANAYPSTPQYENSRIGTMATKYMIVENTGGSNGLTYKVEVKDSSNSDLRTLSVNGNNENNIAANTYDEFIVDGIYTYISVSIKSQTTDNATTFSVRMSARSDWVR